MTNPPVHGRITGPIVMIGFGSIGKGMLPLIERHFDFDRNRLRGHRSERQGPASPRRARNPLHPHRPHAGQLSRDPDALAHRGRRAGLLREPLGRHLLARHHRTVPRDSARSTSTRWRSPGPGSISTRKRVPKRARTTRCARSSSTRAAAIRAAPTAVNCCGANPGMVSWFVKQALLESSQATSASRTRSRPPARIGRA